MVIRIKKIRIIAFFAYVFLFVFNYTFRNIVFTNGLIRQVNVMTLLCFFTIIYIDTRSIQEPIRLNSQKKNTVDTVLYLSLLVVFGISKTLYFGSINSTTLDFFDLIIPVYFVFYRFKSKNNFHDILNLWMTFLSLCTACMLLIGIMDLFTDFNISKSLALLSNDAALIRKANEGRSVSWMGHPLYSAQIYIMFYGFSYLYAKENNKKESIWHWVIAVVGVLTTGSKSALVIILFLYIFLHLKLRKALYVLGGAIVLWVAYELGLLDVVLGRFLEGIAQGDLSTGRNEAFLKLFSVGSYRFLFFCGQPFESGNLLFVSSLEYPILMVAYMYGILVSIIMSVLMFIRPMIKSVFLKTKDYLWVMGAIILDVNLYNGLSNHNDNMLLFCWSVMLLVNMVLIRKENC